MNRTEYKYNKLLLAEWILKRLASNEILEVHRIEDAALDMGLILWDTKNDRFQAITIENDE